MAISCLSEIPLLDLCATDLFKEVYGAGSTAAKGAQDKAGRLVTCDFGARGYVILKLGDELCFVVVIAAAVGESLDARERLAFRVGELPGPCLGWSVGLHAKVARL